MLPTPDKTGRGEPDITLAALSVRLRVERGVTADTNTKKAISF